MIRQELEKSSCKLLLSNSIALVQLQSGDGLQLQWPSLIDRIAYMEFHRHMTFTLCLRLVKLTQYPQLLVWKKFKNWRSRLTPQGNTDLTMGNAQNTNGLHSANNLNILVTMWTKIDKIVQEDGSNGHRQHAVLEYWLCAVNGVFGCRLTKPDIS